jgi:hypothetical protein
VGRPVGRGALELRIHRNSVDAVWVGGQAGRPFGRPCSLVFIIVASRAVAMLFVAT